MLGGNGRRPIRGRAMRESCQRCRRRHHGDRAALGTARLAIGQLVAHLKDLATHATERDHRRPAWPRGCFKTGTGPLNSRGPVPVLKQPLKPRLPSGRASTVRPKGLEFKSSLTLPALESGERPWRANRPPATHRWLPPPPGAGSFPLQLVPARPPTAPRCAG
jgi:hypothetical protein